MVPEHSFDSLPILLVYLIFVGVALLIFEIGFRAGRWWQTRTPDEKEGSTGLLVGSLLTLLAFLLAFSIGMATDRYDARRRLVLLEANAIGTTYLRAGYLPAPADDDVQALLREYVPLRIIPADYDVWEGYHWRVLEIQNEIWTITETLARETPDSAVLAIYIESLNEMIDLQTERFVAGAYTRVPDTVIYLLVVGAVLTVGMVGFNAGLSRKRSLTSAVILIVLTAAVITLVIDLDRPRDGLLKVNQQAMFDLEAQYGDPGT